MEFLSLSSLDEALEKLESFGADATMVAGGTAVRYQIMSGQITPKAVLHIERVAGLSGTSRNGTTRIGALTNLRDLAEDGEIGSRFASVATAAGRCGGWQTQSVATLGGNVCGASPNADLIPPLLVQNAEIELASKARGSRALPLGDFLTDAYRTARAGDEMATAFLLPTPPERSADIYVRIQRRSAMERPIIGLALRLAMDGDRVAEARVAVCGAGPTAFRAAEAEAALAGNTPQGDALAAATEALMQRCVFRDDARASASYRKAVLPRALAHAVATCREAIG
jgi:CO/xanthine dehydrogenase FAD-binding subunit